MKRLVSSLKWTEITWKPTNETHLAGEEAARMQRLIDALDELDDVQQVTARQSLIFRTKNKLRQRQSASRQNLIGRAL